jgi:prepilin-type N-terminal cleavage/methylation domain-containing protein
MRKSRAFTLIELLVVIAIIAVLSVVVILTLNPAQLLAQSRDSSRIADMSTLNSAVGIYLAQGGMALGTSNTVYVSIPDPVATTTLGDQCQGLGLPTLPATYNYHCAATSTYRNIDGTGWIPVNFSTIATGAPLSQLPFDPINTSSSRNYYSYTTNGSNYEVTSVMESAKYKLGGSNDVIASDGGTLASVYEKGSKLGLEPLDYGDTGLVALWSLNEGTGTVAYDYSGNNATGSWNGTATGTNGYYSAGKIGPWSGAFVNSASPNFITTSYVYSTTAASNFTWSGWFNITSVGGNTTLIGNRFGSFWVKITQSGFEYGNGKIITYALPTGAWDFVVAEKSGSNFSYFLNGLLVATATNSSPVSNMPFYLGGDPNFSSDGYLTGFLDDIRVYNRVLSAAEISAFYSGGK